MSKKPLNPRDPTAERRICKCECGGWVYGVEDFGRLFTYCKRCTPVEAIDLPKLRKPKDSA